MTALRNSAAQPGWAHLSHPPAAAPTASCSRRACRGSAAAPPAVQRGARKGDGERDGSRLVYKAHREASFQQQHQGLAAKGACGLAGLQTSAAPVTRQPARCPEEVAQLACWHPARQGDPPFSAHASPLCRQKRCARAPTSEVLQRSATCCASPTPTPKRPSLILSLSASPSRRSCRSRSGGSAAAAALVAPPAARGGGGAAGPLALVADAAALAAADSGARAEFATTRERPALPRWGGRASVAPVGRPGCSLQCSSDTEWQIDMKKKKKR